MMFGFFLAGHPAIAASRRRPHRGPLALCALSAAILALAAAAAPAAESPVVDTDRDGLIEIHTLEDLNSVRYNLAGTSLKRSAKDRGNANGCLRGVCRGYELMANLDFDGSDSDTTTWSRDEDGNIVLDRSDRHREWFDTKAGGWLPIGDCGADGICHDIKDSTDEKPDNRPFTAVFEGNGHTISNLAVSRDSLVVGLFGFVGPGGKIRNLGLVGNLSQYTGSVDGAAVGGLAGYVVRGEITACYATGEVVGGTGTTVAAGGLVGSLIDSAIGVSHAAGRVSAIGASGILGGLAGWKQRGLVYRSHATGDVIAGGKDNDYAGGLVGAHSGGFITASYATGSVDSGDGNSDSAGGLAGIQFDGAITASYATGFVGSGYGSGVVGGLVGSLAAGFVTASYATGAVDGGADAGDGQDMAGGLVGYVVRGHITASYATGDVDGGDERDSVGGLVGRLDSIGSVTASYAIGAADGGYGDEDTVGRLAGLHEGSIKASWGFGARRGGEQDGLDGSPDRPAGIVTAADINPGDSGAPDGPLPVWNSAASRTAGAWDFGTRERNPILVYADYDGDKGVYHCVNDRDNVPKEAILIPNCSSPAATPIPGQLEVQERIRRAKAERAAMPIVDADGDGLIDIHTLEDLNHMRYNIFGTSLKRSPEDPGNARGCPEGACGGYELMADLDFDGPDDDTTTWTRNVDGSFTLDKDDHNSAWFDVEAGGWLPIGDCGTDDLCVGEELATFRNNRPFRAVFEGNGHTIANLATMRALPVIGLFGHTNRTIKIRNLGLVNNLAVSTSSSGPSFVGGLVGYPIGSLINDSYTTGVAAGGSGDLSFVGGLIGLQGASPVNDCYATGDVYGGSAEQQSVGGLVGYLSGNSIEASYALGDVAAGTGGDRLVAGGLVGTVLSGGITASFARGAVSGGDGDSGSVGGLVGLQQAGSVKFSYATGDIDGGNGNSDNVGGLVGDSISSRITAAFATGSVDGGRGALEKVGGLVGYQSRGSITASYATGPVDGGDGGWDLNGNTANMVGGLVGYQSGSIATSYATGFVDGGDGMSDSVGGLAGVQLAGATTDSYATGSVDGGDGREDRVGGLVGAQIDGFIVASHATGSVAGGGFGYHSMVGGLVGLQEKGSIAACYATGDATGNKGYLFRIGGLVGSQTGGSITASYATGDADGGAGKEDSVGGLVGSQTGGSITASYATGDADGGRGKSDFVGGLVGRQLDSAITASYATGDADGGEGRGDSVGAFVGYRKRNAAVEASWGFGESRGGEKSGLDGSHDWPTSLRTAADINLAGKSLSASSLWVWNSAGARTKGAWDFGTAEQNPALVYADYDGGGDSYRCADDGDSDKADSADAARETGAADTAIADSADSADAEAENAANTDNADSVSVNFSAIPNCTRPATLIPGQRPAGTESPKAGSSLGAQPPSQTAPAE